MDQSAGADMLWLQHRCDTGRCDTACCCGIRFLRDYNLVWDLLKHTLAFANTFLPSFFFFFAVSVLGWSLFLFKLHSLCNMKLLFVLSNKEINGVTITLKFHPLGKYVHVGVRFSSHGVLQHHSACHKCAVTFCLLKYHDLPPE